MRTPTARATRRPDQKRQRASKASTRPLAGGADAIELHRGACLAVWAFVDGVWSGDGRLDGIGMAATSTTGLRPPGVSPVAAPRSATAWLEGFPDPKQRESDGIHPMQKPVGLFWRPTGWHTKPKPPKLPLRLTYPQTGAPGAPTGEGGRRLRGPSPEQSLLPGG